MRIVVIGAGSTGTSVAYNLSLISEDEILILDHRPPGNGMTSFSTAVVRTHYSNEITARLALESRNFFEHNQSETGFKKTGMVTVAPAEMKQDLMRNIKMLNRLGIREEFYDAQTASEKFVKLSFYGDEFVSFEPDSGYADPVSTARFFFDLGMRNGVKYQRGNVARVEHGQDNRPVILLDDGSRISSDKVVLCTNIWTNRLLKHSGIDEGSLLPIKVSPHPVLLYRRAGDSAGVIPVVSDLVNRDYYKPEGESLLSGGSLRAELDEVDTDPENFNPEIDFQYIAEYSNRISRRFRNFSTAVLSSYYFGFYDNTPDEHPIVDSLESIGMPNVYCCVGLSGHGFKLSPSLGKLTADLVLQKELPYLKHFKLDRFRRNDSIFRRYKGIGTVA
ncbi:FAD-binding oxidoreductase [Thermoplasmatales archaeon AK]|nr:FAD-binding oxidoreductase [Thermoplasmatales archaeon AK]